MTDATVPATVPTIVDQPMDFTVFANSPADMVSAQKSMILWCARKIQAEKSELQEAQRNLDAAKAHKWSPAAWQRQVTLIGQKIEFYKKVKMALEAGYYIVPPFPIDVFAIRTDRKNPDKKTSTSYWDRHEQQARMLPAGEGRYVSNVPEAYSREVDGPVRDGKPTKVTEYFAHNFLAADFPFKLAKAEVLAATQAAMALGIFDRMGALPAHRAPDPIICGEILMPHRKGQAVTFFVTWWLDTRTL